MGTHHPLAIGAALAIAFLAGTAVAQSPRTMSYQGFLTDNVGEVESDASRTMIFKIYDVPSGGAALWTESQNVSTTNGVFNVVLGSVSPMTGFDFDQELWLGVAVGGDPEMPRTRLTGVPLALALVNPYPDTLRIVTSDLGSDGSERTNEDLTIYANDAIVALYSNGAGAAGSGITLGEINVADLLEDRWSIYRRTKSAGSELRFTYGNANYAVSPTRIEFDTSGVVTASAFKYSEDKESVASIGSYAFSPIISGTAGFRRNSGYSDAGGPSQVLAPIQLPHLAVIRSFRCTMYDTSASTDMTCTLNRTGFDLSAGDVLATVSTTGSSGFQSPSDDLSHTVTNTTGAYNVFVEAPFWGTETTSIRILRVTVTYEMSEVP